LEAAFIAAVLGSVAAMFISYELRLRDLGILLMEFAPIAAAIWIFVFRFKRLRTYMSN
jgi:hypothetical protein